jgi:hypothetical protein
LSPDAGPEAFLVSLISNCVSWAYMPDLEAFLVSLGRLMCLLGVYAGPGSVPCVYIVGGEKECIEGGYLLGVDQEGELKKLERLLSLLRVNKISFSSFLTHY